MQRQKRAEGRGEATLQPARRADADQVPHEQAEIEAAGMNQQALQNVVVAAQMHATHPAGLVEMREGAFQPLAALPQQAPAARAANASTIAIHRVARLGFFVQLRRPRSGSEM